MTNDLAIFLLFCAVVGGVIIYDQKQLRRSRSEAEIRRDEQRAERMTSFRVYGACIAIIFGICMIGGIVYDETPKLTEAQAASLKQQQHQDEQWLEQNRREARLLKSRMCRLAAACRKYNEVRIECATAGSFKTCLRIKMGDDADLCGFDDGRAPVNDPDLPGRFECAFVRAAE